MKKKDMIQAGIALVILLIAGYLIFLQVGPKKSAASAAKGATIEVVTPIQPDFDQASLNQLDSLHDFYTPPDLNAGVGNSQLFSTQ